MRENRLYTTQPLAAGIDLTLESRPARHASQVLRLGQGDALVVFNGDGRDYRARVTQAGRGEFSVRTIDATDPEPLPALEIRLALGISRGERMDLAIQKSVELGAGAIQPLFTSRSVVRLHGDRLLKRAEHWLGVIIAACEQCGRRYLPSLTPAAFLDDWLQPGHPGGILLHHAAARTITELPPPARGLTLLVGPEGGLAADERDRAQALGFTPVRLGPRVMRTETAPLAAIAAIQALWGDFRPTSREGLT